MDEYKFESQYFASSNNVKNLRQNDVVFQEGDLGAEFFIVLEGRVGIFRGQHPKPEFVAELGPRDFFGEMAIVDRLPRSATAIALEDDTIIMSVDAARFIYLVAEQPGFALLIMETLSRRKRESSQDETALSLAEPKADAFKTIQISEDCFQFRSRTRSSNVYLFRGPRRTVLVDTGLSSSASELMIALETAGIAPLEVDMIVLTHEHFDHISGVPAFRGKPIVAAFGLAANKIRLGDEFATLRTAFKEPAADFAIDIELASGSYIDTGCRRLVVEHTPGHSSGGISLIDEANGLVVCGDTLLKGGPIGGIFGSGNISDLIGSLERLKRFSPKLLLPGHGPVSNDPLRDIDLAIERCNILLEDTRKLFSVLQANRKIWEIVNAYRDLNRSFNT